MSKRALSLEMRNAVIWLERQPEVTSVVQGRYNAVRHKHEPGFTRVISTDKKCVHLRTYDKHGNKDLFVYAPPSPLRDRWVAALASGDIFSANGKAPKLAADIKPTTPNGSQQVTIAVPTPKPLNAEAGQLFDVTPTLAAKWLERNTRNRSLRNDIVERYAADMKAGRWMVTGDAIAFDKNGVIVNGQHRLWAVIFAELSVPMLVTFNLEPDVVRVLDDHLKRKLTDIIKIAKPGTTITAKMTSVSLRMQRESMALNSVDVRAMQKLSRQQQMQFLEKHQEAIDFAVRECFKSSTIRGLGQATILAVVARAYYSQDHDRLKAFGKILLSGIPDENTGDIAALLLRNWILSAGASMKPQPEVIYRKTSRALLAFCQREKLKTLYEASSELFLLPEDKAPKKVKDIVGRSTKKIY